MAACNEKFLFVCMDNMNDSKTVNWAKVAEECNIPSAGAASIKFRRMKKKFMEDDGSNGTNEETTNVTPKKGAKKADGPPKTPKKSSPKKRKQEVSEDDEDVKDTKHESKDEVDKLMAELDGE